jgi:hypothetical protein
MLFFGIRTKPLSCTQDVLTAALESGISTFLFPRELLDLADSWGRLGRMACVFSNGDTLLDSRMEVISHRKLPLGTSLQSTFGLVHCNRLRSISGGHEGVIMLIICCKAAPWLPGSRVAKLMSYV